MAAVTHDGTTRLAGGLGLAVVSAASFGLSGPLARGLMDAGWSAAAAVTVRVLLAGVALAPAAVVALRGRWALLRRSAPLLAGYGLVAVAGCQLAYFTAVAHLPVGVALLVEYTAPVAVVGWMWLRHAQRPTGPTVTGAVLGIAGLLLVIDVVGSASGGGVDAVGVEWALVAMLGAAVYFVLSAGAAPDGPPAVVLAAGGLLVGGAALAVAGAVGIVPFTVTTAPVVLAGATVSWWVPVLVLGLVTAGLAYVSGIAAARALGARLASFVALLEVVAALVFAWLLLGELPRPVQVAGGVLVLAGIVVVKLGERGPRRAATPEPAAASR